MRGWDLDALLKTPGGRRNRRSIEDQLGGNDLRPERKGRKTETKTKAAKVAGEVHDEVLFFEMLRQEGLPIPEREYGFSSKFSAKGHPRKFRSDYSWPHSYKKGERVSWSTPGAIQPCLIVEVDGGINMTHGGHSSTSGIREDIDKQNHAVIEGFRTLRVEPSNLCTGEFIAILKEAFYSGGD